MTQAAGVKYSGIIPCGGGDHRGKWSFWGKIQDQWAKSSKRPPKSRNNGENGGKKSGSLEKI